MFGVYKKPKGDLTAIFKVNLITNDFAFEDGYYISSVTNREKVRSKRREICESL